MAAKKTTASEAAPKAETANFEDVAAFGQQNLDAMVKASEAATKAAEGIGEEITTFSKKSFEDLVAVAQDLSTAKTATELFEKQSAFAKSAFEGFMTQAGKMNDMYAAAAKDMSAPLNARMVSIKPFAA